MREYQIADRPASESVWRRTWDDTKLSGNSWLLWIFEALIGVPAIILPIVFNYQAMTIAVISVVGLSVLPVSVFVVSVCRAPFKQRSEARREAIRLLELRKPKLTVTIRPERMLPELGWQLEEPNLPSGFGIRIRNEADEPIKNCYATILNMDATKKYISRTDGGVTTYRDDEFDEGWVSGDIPRRLIWPGGETAICLRPRDQYVIDVFHYIFGDERPLKLNTLTSSDTHELQDDVTLFLISAGDEDGLPVFCVCEYVPNAPTHEKWSLRYEGPDQPDLKDYQSFEEIPPDAA